jgi:ribosomal-protein-alanine N-acetyltransferase
MPAPTRFATARLLFERPTIADAAAIFARYASDADVTRLLSWPRHTSVTDTEAFLGFSAAEWQRAGVGPYLIRSLGDSGLLGSTGLMVDEAGDVMTGYVLARDAWGWGYATESLGAMVDLARSLSSSRMYAYSHPDNQASIRVLTKCGFVCDEHGTEPTVFPNLGADAVATPKFVRLL